MTDLKVKTKFRHFLKNEESYASQNVFSLNNNYQNLPRINRACGKKRGMFYKGCASVVYNPSVLKVETRGLGSQFKVVFEVVFEYISTLRLKLA